MENIKEETAKEIEEEEEFNKNLEEMNKTIKEIETPSITNTLRDFQFKNKMDEEVFNRLPLTNIQKEYLLLSVNTDLLKGEVPAEHGYIEEEKKIVEEGTMSPSNPTRTLGEEVHEDISIEVKK